MKKESKIFNPRLKVIANVDRVLEFIDTGKIVDYIDVMANLKFDDGTTYMDYLKEKKDKADRCLRVARRKMPQSSAYRSGLIVKCRKGMIWKKEK